MNHLEGFTQLEHTYYVMRHGRSDANDKEIIVSISANGYGLTYDGREEAQKNIDNAIMDNARLFTEPVVIFSSPFKRTHETARIVQKSLHASEVLFHSALKERYFGNFEGQSVDNYQRVWEEDMRSIEQSRDNVESVAKVVDRMTGFIKNLERGRYAKDQGGAKTVFLISHGDPLQILQTVFEGKNPKNHRSLPQLKTGEIRELKWKPLV